MCARARARARARAARARARARARVCDRHSTVRVVQTHTLSQSKVTRFCYKRSLISLLIFQWTEDHHGMVWNKRKSGEGEKGGGGIFWHLLTEQGRLPFFFTLGQRYKQSNIFYFSDFRKNEIFELFF